MCVTAAARCGTTRTTRSTCTRVGPWWVKLTPPDDLMDSRQALDARAITLMGVLCAIWGMQQVVLKATAADISPIMQIGLRSGVAALLVGVLMAGRGERMDPHDGTLRPGMVVGLLFGLEFLLVAEGLRHTSASHMVV